MIVSTSLIPKGFSACSLWPFIFVRPEHRSDIALIEHELVHYREQAWIVPGWVLMYLVSRKFRLAAEIRAYTPDGHFKFPHLWPVKFPQAGRLNYQLFGLSGSDFLSW